jgi:hypothetical protein
MKSVEISNSVRKATLAILPKIPQVGSLLSALVNVLWKEAKEDVWSTVRSRVEEVVEDKIAENHLATLEETLKGIQTTLELLRADFTRDNWRENFNYLNRFREVFLATNHNERYQLIILPQAALFGVLLTILWKEGKLQDWVNDTHTNSVKDFYQKLRTLTDTQYQRKIRELKTQCNWSASSFHVSEHWQKFVDLHNMFVWDIYSYIETIDGILNDNKEINQKYEIYGPAIGKMSACKLENIPIDFRARTIKKLGVRHGSAIDGLHVVYSDGSTGGAGSSNHGAHSTEIDLTGRYITKIDFYCRTGNYTKIGGWHEGPAYSEIGKIKFYFSDGNSTECGQNADGTKSSLEYEGWCVSWIDGNPTSVYYNLGLQIGLIPVEEYTKLL